MRPARLGTPEESRRAAIEANNRRLAIARQRWTALREEPRFWLDLVSEAQRYLADPACSPAAVDALTLLADGARALLALNRTETT